MDDLQNKRALLLYYIELCAQLQGHWYIQTGVTVRKRLIRVKIGDFFCPWWPWKTIGHLFYTASSFVQQFIVIGAFKLKLQSGNAQYGTKSTMFYPCDLEMSRMTLQYTRAPLPSHIKVCASFRHHMWMQTAVTVCKPLNGVMTSVTLTFDLCPWTFAWTSRLSMVITSGNFRMIRSHEHGHKGVTDGRTDNVFMYWIMERGSFWGYGVQGGLLSFIAYESKTVVSCPPCSPLMISIRVSSSTLEISMCLVSSIFLFNFRMIAVD